MIRHPDNFPDLDELINEAATKPPEPKRVLEYHGPTENTADTVFGRRARRVFFAIALALLAGGLGRCLSRFNEEGPAMMGVGGGVLGLLLPLPDRKPPR